MAEDIATTLMPSSVVADARSAKEPQKKNERSATQPGALKTACALYHNIQRHNNIYMTGREKAYAK